jgi:hypothetical protein
MKSFGWKFDEANVEAKRKVYLLEQGPNKVRYAVNLVPIANRTEMVMYRVVPGLIVNWHVSPLKGILATIEVTTENHRRMPDNEKSKYDSLWHETISFLSEERRKAKQGK